MTRRQEKVSELIKELAASYLLSEANRSPMITVTRVDVSPDMSKSTVYLSVFPEDKEGEALAFAKRKLREFREHVKSKTSFKRVPFFDFVIDNGEKNRQRIDELLLGS